jgi:NitT/TauT family transport system substrate-binding protein
MRAGLTSGTMQLVVMPTTTAANLFNRGLGVRLVNVMTNGLLHVVSADPTLTSVPVLRGKRIALPFRNDTPEFVFNRLLRAADMSPARDIAIDTTGTTIEAIQLLLAGRVDAALVPEPAASAAIVRGGAASKTIHRVIDVQAAWGQLTGRGPVLPQAGLAVVDTFRQERPDIVEAVQRAIEIAARRVVEQPARAANDAASALELPWPVIERSIPHSNLVATRARDARPDLEAMFTTVADANPGLIGGKLPEGGFYL